MAFFNLYLSRSFYLPILLAAFTLGSAPKLQGAPKISLSKEILELRSGFETKVQAPTKTKNRITLNFDASMPLSTRFTTTRGIPFSSVQRQGVELEYSLELISDLETRVGIGFEYLKASAFETVGLNTVVDNFSLKKIPSFHVGALYLLKNTSYFSFGVGADLGIAKQKYKISSTDTSATTLSGSHLSLSGQAFLESQFHRWGPWTGIVKTGWNFNKLPTENYDNNLNVISVNSWEQGLLLSIGLGRRF